MGDMRVDKKKEQRASQIEVALLLSDLKEVKKISEVFRQIGVIPHYYEDLRSLWNGTLEKIPSLCLVDVVKMSEGELLLRNHPYVKTKEMNLCFLYSEDTTPLLYSTFEIYNIGLINKSLNFKGQLKSILRRHNKLIAQDRERQDLKLKNNKLDRQMTGLVKSIESYKEKEFYKNKLRLFYDAFEKNRDADDFFVACENVLSNREEILEFAFLELSHNGQKLMSPSSRSLKFKKIPSLWLGHTCKDGIEFFGQNLACQVSVDIMGGDIISLMIKGKRNLPEKILFVRAVDEEMLNNFSWEDLERYLHGLYAYFELKNNKISTNDKRILESWELLSYLDQYYFGKLPTDLALDQKSNPSPEKTGVDDISLIDIDFSNLVDLIRSNTTMRFYWRDFFHDFIGRLEAVPKMDFKVTCMGVDHIGLVVDHEQIDKTFSAVKSFVLKYPYWRYFEDVDIVLARTMKPSVKMVPLSSEAYLRLIDGQETTSFVKDWKEEKIRTVAEINDAPSV